MTNTGEVEPLHYREHRKFHFDPNPNAPILRLKDIQSCPYCQAPLVQKSWGREIWDDPLIDWIDYYKGTCEKCGWWKIFEEGEAFSANHSYVTRVLTCGILRAFDVDTLGLSCIDDIFSSLDEMFCMHPRDFEVFIAGTLAELFGCKAIHTGKSHDGGIDIILLGTSVGEIPVQVKRRTKPTRTESVALVREFRGAMLLNGYSEGIIVSNADHFSREAERISAPEHDHLAEQTIRLIDCRTLIDILGLLKVAREPSD